MGAALSSSRKRGGDVLARWADLQDYKDFQTPACQERENPSEVPNEYTTQIADLQGVL